MKRSVFKIPSLFLCSFVIFGISKCFSSFIHLWKFFFPTSVHWMNMSHCFLSEKKCFKNNCLKVGKFYARPLSFHTMLLLFLLSSFQLLFIFLLSLLFSFLDRFPIPTEIVSHVFHSHSRGMLVRLSL